MFYSIYRALEKDFIKSLYLDLSILKQLGFYTFMCVFTTAVSLETTTSYVTI